MSRNNQNNTAAWAKRVREYNVIPDDDAYSAERSWEKLQRRLDHKPAKRTIYFYWAAAVIIAIIVIPLLWHKQNNDTGKLPGEPIVTKPSIKEKSPGVISKPELKQLIVLQNQHQEELQAEKNKKALLIIKDKLVIEDQRDSIKLVTNNDSLSVNKSLASVDIRRDTANQRKTASIVHINNINSDQPQSEVEYRKFRKFLRRYDVDVPHKTDATGSLNNGSKIKDIN